MADESEVIEEEVDDLEVALRENAKLKAENVRLKKGKKGETDDKLKGLERDAKKLGYEFRIADNKKKIRDLEKKPSHVDQEISDLEKKNKLAKLEHEHSELHPRAYDYWVLGGMALVTLVVLGFWLATTRDFGGGLATLQDGVYNFFGMLAGGAIALAVTAGALKLLFQGLMGLAPKSSGKGGGGGKPH